CDRVERSQPVRPGLGPRSVAEPRGAQEVGRQGGQADVGRRRRRSPAAARAHPKEAVMNAGPLETARERAICERYAKRIRSYGLCHLRDGTSAEDLVQHVLLAVLQALRDGRVGDTANLDKYVFGTCRNTVKEFRRGTARERRIADASATVLPAGHEPPWHV